MLFYAYTSNFHAHPQTRFLWARLQMDVLWDTCTTEAEIDLAINNLPKDLDATYERCLHRVAEKQQQYSLRVLRYVYEAKSPLSIDALGEALATDPDTGELQYAHIPAHTAIIRSGANLIIFDEVERLVVPAHHSVRKFLNNSKAPILEELGLPVLDDAVLNLGEMCIAHLIWHTSDHGAKKARPAETSDTIQVHLPSVENMSKWIQPPDSMLSRLMSPWLPKRKDNSPFSTTGKQAPVNLTLRASRTKALRLYGPLYHYARENWIVLSYGIVADSTTWWQFRRLVELDLDDSQNEYKRGDSTMFPWKSDSLNPLRGKILGWAICEGHLRLLELGIELQRDMSMPLDDYGGLVPLHLAATRGRVDVFDKVNRMKTVRSLYRCPKTGRTALHHASEHGHAEVTRHWLRSVMPVSSNVADSPDREGHTAFGLAISSGSLTTVELLNIHFGTLLWRNHPTSVLLDALVAGGSKPETIEYVTNMFSKRLSSDGDPKDKEYLTESVLCWILRTNDPSLIPSFVKAGISLDISIDSRHIVDDPGQTRIRSTFSALETPTSSLASAFIERALNTKVDSSYIVDDRGRTRSPAIFFALEASSPAIASAFIDNGANLSVEHRLKMLNKYSQSERYRMLYPIDLILSRGWTSLASTICPQNSEYGWGELDSYNERHFLLEATSKEVYWFSILTSDWVILNVKCCSHDPCTFTTQLEIYQRFLFVRYEGNDQSHSFVITMICKSPERVDLQFTLMMGTKETTVADWRVGQPSTALSRLSGSPAIHMEHVKVRQPLRFNENPYNIQVVSIPDDGFCRSDRGHRASMFRDWKYDGQ
jgi:ankyrin repeat protein